MKNSILRRRTGALVAAVAALGGVLLSSPSSAPAAPPKAGDSCGALLAKPSGGTWACSFVDDFSGTTVDGNKWLIGETSATGFHTGITCFDKDNVAVKKGTLRIVARDEGYTFRCANPYAPFDTRYTGGHLATNGKFAQAYGRFEARVRHPATGPGVHAGFWMYPAKQTYGAWPASGEIDVAEWWSNNPTYVLPTLHYNGSTLEDSGAGCRVADPTVFHTYAVVWSPTEMRFSIDGQECFVRSWTPEAPMVAPAPFDQPFVMVLGNGVGEASGPNTVGAQTTLPATYEVDYVKAWR